MAEGVEKVKERLSKIKEEDIIIVKHIAGNRSLTRDINEDTIKYYVKNPNYLTKVEPGRRGKLKIYFNISKRYDLVLVVIFEGKKLIIVTVYKKRKVKFRWL